MDGQTLTVSLINIIVATPEPVSIKTIHPQEECHTADYICDIFNCIITDRARKNSGICTDNVPLMKGSWAEINEKNLFIATYRYSAHSFNLIAKDICKLNRFTKKFAVAKHITHFFKNKHFAMRDSKKSSNQANWSRIVSTNTG